MVYFLRIFFLLLIVSLQIAAVPVFAETVPVAEFDSESEQLDLTDYIKILPDPEKSLDLSDIVNGKHKDFQSVSEISNSFGFSKSAYWVHFSLHMNQDLQDSPLLQLKYPFFDHVTLYIPDGFGGYSKKVTGDALPFAEREVNHRTYLFRLPSHKGQVRDYYMRLQTEGSTQISLSLWKAETFIEEVDGTNFLLGGYYGVMVLLMLTAFVSFWKIGDKLFLFYGLYLLSYILFQFSLNGFSYQYLWPELPWFTNRATAAFVGLVVVAGMLFAGSFLRIWGNRHPRVKVLFYILIAWGAVGALLSLFGDYVFAVKLSAVSGLFLPPIILIAILSSLAIGYRPARYFLVAWCVFLFGVFVEGLLYLGLIPHSFLSVNAMQIGSVFEVVLLGYALMDRIGLLRIDKEKAIVQANEYLQQLNEKLEILVNERTKKLQEQNKKLGEIAVQDSMTGLLNHKASLEFLRLRKSSAQRYGKNLAVIMLDIDRFKLINDRFGHPAGDEVLTIVAAVLKATLRETDGCGRYGGEEFLLILPESDAENACYLAERIKKNIEALKIPEIDNIPVTASFGVAVFNPLCPDENLISFADSALYDAKKAGRNRVVLSATHR
jgi:diguanylate cyclase (GGDEF)-like protein